MDPLARWQAFALMSTPLVGIVGLVSWVYAFSEPLPAPWGSLLYYGGGAAFVASLGVAALLLLTLLIGTARPPR